jgi:DNA repair/transcription protein MET18/MMS19
MGDESLTGITTLVGGEKDPRNLMLVFSMLRVIMVEWDISQHSELMFDSVYAYFPITFRPPPNDPYGITAQDLKDRLRDCLSSTGLLAIHSIPSLLDRLDSTSPTVKKDVLQALAACASNWDIPTLSQYSVTLWEALKFEVLQAQEPELADEALIVMRDIATNLSQSPSTSPTASPLAQYLKPVTKQCIENFQEPASRQAKASGDIVKAVASASVKSFEFVAKSIGPALLTLQQSQQGTIAQRAILEATNQLFEAAIVVYGSWTSLSARNPEGRENLLLENKEKLVAMYSQALMGTVKEEVSFRLTAAKGLKVLSSMRSFLQDDEIGLFVQYFDDIVLKEESYGRDELKTKAMEALADLSRFKPRLIADITFPAFMAQLPDSEDDAKSSNYHSVLEALAEISVEKDLLETMMRRLLNKLDVLFRIQAADPKPYPYTCAILGTIRYVLDRTAQAPDIELDPYFERVVVGLTKSAATAVQGPLVDASVLDLLGRVANIVCRKSSSEKQDRVAANIYALFRDIDAGIGIATLLDAPSPIIQSTWLLASLPRSLHSPNLQAGQIMVDMDSLLYISSKTSSSAVELSCLRQVALYINKHLSTSDLPPVDTLLQDRLQQLSQTLDPKTSSSILRLAFFITKSLILRLAPNTNTYLTNLVSLLASTHVTISNQAASLFHILLSPDPVLSKENFFQIRLLAPQRVFQTLVPLIAERFKASTLADEKQNYLIALSGILSPVPSEIVMPELPTLLPLLLQSLDLADQTVKSATLETLTVVITHNPSALQESGHIPALTKRLLATSTLPGTKTKSRANMKTTTPTPETLQNLPRTRRLALKCLGLMPQHLSGDGKGVNPLLPLKKEVLMGLMGVLDDPKREVRKEGVDARAGWLRGVDDVEEEEE